MQRRLPNCSGSEENRPGLATPDSRGSVSSPVWVILPTYCEAENILDVLAGLGRCGLGLNILVVDDNSPDGTGEIVEDLRSKTPGLHLLRRTAKTSLGDAYLTGFEHALSHGAKVVITMDCDLSHDPMAVPALVDQLDGNACVVGSRYVPGGKILNWPRRRLILSRAANRFVHLLFRIPIKDCTSGFRVYRSSVVEKVLAAKVHSHGYSFQVEALVIAVGSGLGVVESPITFVERVKGVSKMGMNEVVDGATALGSLWLNPSQRPLGDSE